MTSLSAEQGDVLLHCSRSSNLEEGAWHLVPLCGSGGTKTVLWDGESWGLSWSGERKTQGMDAPRLVDIHSSDFTSIQLFLNLKGTQAGQGITWKEQGARELEEKRGS